MVSPSMSPVSGDALSSCAASLRRLVLAAERLRTLSAHDLGVPVSDTQALSHLVATGPLGATELASALHMTTGSVTTLVDRLVARGYVERVPHRLDRRRSVIQLTPSGSAMLADAGDWAVNAIAGIASDRYGDLAGALGVIADALTDAGSAIARQATDTAVPEP